MKTILDNGNQPYLYYNNHNKILLYCYANSIKTFLYGNEYSIKPWKIYFKNLTDNTDKVLQTPSYHSEYGNVVVECNPHIIVDKNINYLYYNAGFNQGLNTPIIYYLCRVAISDLNITNICYDTFSIVHKCFTGTSINDNTIVSADQISSNLSLYSNFELIKNINLLPYNISQIYKINKIFNQNKYIVTGSDNSRNIRSILLDNEFCFVSEIFNENQQPVYKCSILDNIIAYTIRIEDNTIENRKIIITDFIQ